MLDYIKYSPTSGLVKATEQDPVPTTETTVVEITEKSFFDEGSQLAIYYDFTLGSLDSAILRIYIDPGDGEYYQIPGIDEDLTFLVDSKEVFALPVYPMPGTNAKLKITIQGYGTNTGSKLNLSVANRNN